MKKILILLGSVLFLFSTILVTASATQIPVVGEYDYGNLEYKSLLNTYEYTIETFYEYDIGDGTLDSVINTVSSTYPSSIFQTGNVHDQLWFSWNLSQSVYVDKVYFTLAVSDLAVTSYFSFIELLYSAGDIENSVSAYWEDLTLYDQFYSNGYYYLCYCFYVSDLSSDFPEGFDVNRVSIFFDSYSDDGMNYFISISQLFTTSSLTYPIKESGVEIYSTPGSDQVPGTSDLKHSIYGYPWELTVADERPQSIYFDRQQGLMIQSINFDYGEATFIDKMKIVYFIVGDNPQFGVTVLSQDDYGSIISSVPDYKVEIGTPTPRAPVEWNGDNIMPDYYEVSIDLKGYNLADCTVTISCLVDAIEDPNPNNANRINYFYFFGNFIGYYTKDLSQAEDPNLKWVTFIGDKLDSILEYFKQPEGGNDVIDNIGSSVDDYHDLEQDIINDLPDLDFTRLPTDLYGDFDEVGQQNQFLILSSIANKPSIARLIIISCLLGVVAAVLFIKR